MQIYTVYIFIFNLFVFLLGCLKVLLQYVSCNKCQTLSRDAVWTKVLYVSHQFSVALLNLSLAFPSVLLYIIITFAIC